MKTPQPITIADQLAALQRIGMRAATVRGHDLGDWQLSEDCAHAICLRCHAALRVYRVALQPVIDGPALEYACAVCEWAA